MADKRLYIVKLVEGCDQDHFLHHGDASTCECNSHLKHFHGLVSMRLTEEEAIALNLSSDVESIELEDEVEEDNVVNFKTRANKTLITRTLPSSSNNGADYGSTYFHFTSNTTNITGDNPGYFTEINEDANVLGQNINQTFAGEFVDVVAIEAGTPVSNYQSWAVHPDFVDSQENSKFVPMDWTDHGIQLASTINNQLNGSPYFSAHAIGVLSIMGGTVCSWANVSSLRVIYLGDGVSAAYNAVLDWHLNKPINPLTGKRNATVTSGSWGYTHTTLNDAVRCDQVDEIVAFDDQGNSTTITRPGGGWGNDLSSFYDNLLIPRVIRDPDTNISHWMIPWGRQFLNSAWQLIMQNYAVEGLYHFKSMGNDGAISVEPDDPRYNTSITTDASYDRYSLGTGPTFSFTKITENSAATVYPLRHYTNGIEKSTTFYVSASQHSTANPLLDDYSGRGPSATISGLGSFTFTSYPGATLNDGGWNYFGGTSNAAPSVAGIAAVIIGWWLVKYAKYPTQQELIQFITDNAQPIIVGEETVDFTNVPSPDIFANNRLYSTNDVYSISNSNFWNGSTDLTELAGNTNLRVYLPDFVRLDYGYNVPQVRSKTLGTRPATGQCYPRRKIKID